jgi:AAA ATPase domain
VLLERTDQLSALSGALEAVIAARTGAVVFVGGEAGAGKTALVRAFCDGRRDAARILWGACGGLLTPGPLGPLFDIAELTRGELEELVSREARPHEVTGALVRELAGGRPTVLVLRTSTGPTRRRSTCCACWPARSRPCPPSSSPATATTSSTGSTRSRSCSESWPRPAE